MKHPLPISLPLPRPVVHVCTVQPDRRTCTYLHSIKHRLTGAPAPSLPPGVDALSTFRQALRSTPPRLIEFIFPRCNSLTNFSTANTALVDQSTDESDIADISLSRRRSRDHLQHPIFGFIDRDEEGSQSRAWVARVLLVRRRRSERRSLDVSSLPLGEISVLWR